MDEIPADEDFLPEETPAGESAPAQPLPQGEAVDDGRGRIFPCPECGADLVFHIGDQELRCPYCGGVKTIELGDQTAIQEQDFAATLERLRLQKEQQADSPVEHSEVRCESCGGEVIFEGTLTSSACPYCGSPIQRDKIHQGGFRVPVDAVLPFKVEERLAGFQLTKWVKSRWFAPNDFKKTGAEGKFNGVYLPFWTFDSLTYTSYSGQRGDNYTVTVGSGKNRRTETRTRWSSRSGKFQRFFDDVLVNATKELPVEHIDNLAPWPLQDCAPFKQEYLAGHLARTYDLGLEDGFTIARARVKQELHADCCRRIGGDKQIVDRMDVRLDALTFKHLLLPVWMLAYRYRGRRFNVFINAVTGEVHGDRPYSWIKITLAVLAAVAAVIGIYAMMQR